MDEKSSQTSEMAVKISEKHSKLALERALMPTKRRRTRDYAADYDGTVQCRLYESQNVPCQHASHDLAKQLIYASHMIQTAVIRLSHDSNSTYSVVT